MRVDISQFWHLFSELRDINSQLWDIKSNSKGKKRRIFILFFTRNCNFISCNSDFISRNCDFISQNCDFISHNSDFISRNSEKKSHNSDLIYRNCEKKSQNCEIKSRNYYYLFIIQKICHLLNLILFQTCMHFFLEWMIREFSFLMKLAFKENQGQYKS